MLDLKLKQEIKLSTDLKQAIDILQYDILKLNEALLDERDENPILEVNETSLKKEMEVYSVKDAEAEEPYINNYNAEDFTESNYYINNYVLENIDITDKGNETLYDNLMIQLNTSDIDDELYQICIKLIENINEKGFLQKNITELEKETKIESSKLKKALNIIQSFYPTGVGARNYAECIILQLKKQGIYTDDHKILLMNFLKELAYKQYEKIAKKTDLDIEYIKLLTKEITSTDINFASEFAKNDTVYITPEVILEVKDGKVIIYLKDDLYPILSKNEKLVKQIDIYNKSSSEYKKLKKYIDKADFYINALEQRKENTLKIAREIFNIQDLFLSENKLKSLTMEEIANKTNLSTSTVSRIVSGKYIQTPRGIYPLKYFFTTNINNSTEEEIKQKIYDIVNLEDKAKPLSDDKIAAMLKKDNIKVSRRTVAKYRDLMGIPSSYNRKKEKENED